MRRLLFILTIICTLIVGCTVQNETSNTSNSEKTTEKMTTKKEYTEQEYKNMCYELYNDDFFKTTPRVGKYVKVRCMISEKYAYTSSSMQGILVKDITEQYNLKLRCLGCTVMHEETKNDSVPSYFGKQVYIMVDEETDFYFDFFETGDKIIIYGEIIQNKNGNYILLKYVELDV